MATALLKLLYVLLLVSISSRGIRGALAQPCGQSSIQVKQSSTGARQGFDQEFAVEITNACACTQTNVSMYAPGFASRKSVDPRLFMRVDGGVFLVDGGNPIPPGATVKFTYWWDRWTYMTPAASRTLCP